MEYRIIDNGNLSIDGFEITEKSAQILIPILQYFVKTGMLPESQSDIDEAMLGNIDRTGINGCRQQVIDFAVSMEKILRESGYPTLSDYSNGTPYLFKSLLEAMAVLREELCNNNSDESYKLKAAVEVGNCAMKLFGKIKLESYYEKR